MRPAAMIDHAAQLIPPKLASFYPRSPSGFDSEAGLGMQKGDMITLRIPSHLFNALRAGFEAAAYDDRPFDTELLDRVRAALAKASATALPGLPILVALESEDELYALATCFEVGGEDHPGVTEDHWASIQALFVQAV
jgi:hypothetical protein